MTTITDEGLRWYRDASISANEEIDTIAVGTGTSKERTDDTSLDNEEYRTSFSDADAGIREGQDFAEYEAFIDITGGGAVNAGVDITEAGIFAEGGTANERLIARDVFSAVTIKSGIKERFRVFIEVNR